MQPFDMAPGKGLEPLSLKGQRLSRSEIRDRLRSRLDTPAHLILSIKTNLTLMLLFLTFINSPTHCASCNFFQFP